MLASLPPRAARCLQMPNVEGTIEAGKKRAKKNIDVEMHGIWGKGRMSPLKPEVYTPSGWPASSTPVLRSLAGKPGAAKRALAELDGAETLANGIEGTLLLPLALVSAPQQQR